MNHEEYEVMYQVEDHHWWYRGMQHITCRLLDREVGRTGQLRILDAGCGTGAVLSYLQPYGQTSGFDYAAEALRFSKQRGHDNLSQASVMQLPYADQTFDLITSFDVISAAGVDDQLSLSELARVLKPGGGLLLRLPAYHWMHGRHDIAVQVVHRFTRGELKPKLDQAGFKMMRLSYANTFLFPIAILKRFSERIFTHQTGSDLTLNPGRLNRVLQAILSAEAPLVASIGLPFGLTLVAFARKAR
jgi:ubiquinone/menaquinone biosynthesis C-methylase UbiE